jgi:hypothetical protein
MNATDQQIKDLETIAQIEESGSEEDNDEEDEEAEDSDAEDMARIQNYGSDEEMKSGSDQDDDEEMESGLDSEEGEDEDVEMSSSSGSEKKGEKKLSGKQALRAQITQEKEIRAKEAQMRSTDGSNPQTVNDFERLLIADQD